MICIDLLLAVDMTQVFFFVLPQRVPLMCLSYHKLVEVFNMPQAFWGTLALRLTSHRCWPQAFSFVFPANKKTLLDWYGNMSAHL